MVNEIPSFWRIVAVAHEVWNLDPFPMRHTTIDYMASLLQEIAGALRPGGILSLQAGEETRAGELDQLRELAE